MQLPHIIEVFEGLGGRFITPAKDIQRKLQTTNTLLFDWDGVFHDGHKDQNGVSQYSEADSMGINMLRFGVWLAQGEQLPFTGVISGEQNPTAAYWAKRDNLNVLLMGFNHKAKALHFLAEEYPFVPEHTLFVYDDILDLSIAQHCGLRILVRKKANPLFQEYCIEHGWVDYITGCKSGEHAVREVSELCLSLLGQFATTIDHRSAYSPTYTRYNQHRKAIRLAKIHHNPSTGKITHEANQPIGFRKQG